jgi:hypothetical protein
MCNGVSPYCRSDTKKTVYNYETITGTIDHTYLHSNNNFSRKIYRYLPYSWPLSQSSLVLATQEEI